jgi:SNF2 family DNA or RNA helicase
MYPLFDHQKVSIQFILNRERTFDASDPGTGKTRTAIEVFQARRVRGSGCCLVLAPKSLLRSAWQDDFLSFAPTLKTTVAFAENRDKAFEENSDVYITNIDATKWLLKQPASFWKRFEGGMLIVDESSAFKHHTSQRSRALNKIKKYFKYRHNMTGTPSSNAITDLWNQVNILDDGQRLGTSFYAFRANACEPQQVGPRANMIKWVDKKDIQLIVGKLIEDITIRHKFEDCIDIPENVLRPINYYMPPAQQRVYQDMEENAVALLASGQIVDAINGAAVMTKLLQIASGAVYDNSGNYSKVDPGRYELVADLVEERKHSVVFFQWNHQRDQLIKEFDSRGITYVVIDGHSTDKERHEAVKNFQSGFYRVVLAHPKSAAHGLTLTRGTATIWASPTYNLEHWLQGNRRIYRAGQKDKTETIVVVAPGTIEERVALRLQEKDTKQMDLLTLLELPERWKQKLGTSKSNARHSTLVGLTESLFRAGQKDKP